MEGKGEHGAGSDGRVGSRGNEWGSFERGDGSLEREANAEDGDLGPWLGNVCIGSLG